MLADWLIGRPYDWAAGVEVASLDPFRGCLRARSVHDAHGAICG
jgi:hypothetical protein